MPQQRIPDQRRTFAKRLRSRQSIPETRLWHELRGTRLDGWKFRRQVPLEQYIVDFVCFEARLIVEVDGPLHDRPESVLADAARDAVLHQKGFRVLRFTSDVALVRMLDEIRQALSEPPLPAPR
jgi:very-short-patch-repair endonuclease